MLGVSARSSSRKKGKTRTAKRSGLFSTKTPTPKAAARKLGKSLGVLARDSLSILSTSVKRVRSTKSSRKKKSR